MNAPAPVDGVDAVVVGAGVVGLACARALALHGLSVALLEAAATYGSGTSSRNSEVIHAGVYYPPGSLKARLCLRGRELLYDYCATHGVPHRRCGKLLVATRAAELAPLDAIRARAEACGVRDLQPLTGAQALALEPALKAHAALYSPASGIIDSHALMTALLGDAESAGALFARRSPFVGAQVDGQGWRVAVGGAEPFALRTHWLINATGLQAQAVARAMQGFDPAHVPPRWLAKGNYFALGGRSPFTRLIYPMPVDGGLGVHLTLDLNGQARFGPDVEHLPAGVADAALDYAVDPRRQAVFEAEVRRYWPGLPAHALQPAYSGIRPKLNGPGDAAADFRIDGPAEHGSAGVVQLFGIESPGLTACLAIGEQVVARVRA
jgi:L-2-hydroxyglutarate oxidase LhgO